MSDSQAVKISVVSPVYGCASALPELVEKLKQTLERITPNYEIILVNDGSPDNAWELISQFASEDSRIKGICLSRNFGQHPAIFCGLAHSKGEAVIVIDCDLQEDPIYIPALYEKFLQGYQVVYTMRRIRRDAWWRGIGAKLFFRVYNYLVDDHFRRESHQLGSFSLISRQVVDELIKLRDCQFHYLLLVKWLGFKSFYLEIDHKERFYGRSSYTLSKLIDHAIVGIVFHSNRLLTLSIYVGVVISIFAFLLGLVIIVRHLLFGLAPGWPSLFVLNLFSMGIILIFLGVLGLYVGKIFDQVKGRPIFVIEKKLNI